VPYGLEERKKKKRLSVWRFEVEVKFGSNCWCLLARTAADFFRPATNAGLACPPSGTSLQACDITQTSADICLGNSALSVLADIYRMEILAGQYKLCIEKGRETFSEICFSTANSSQRTSSGGGAAFRRVRADTAAVQEHRDSTAGSHLGKLQVPSKTRLREERAERA
jgi:hypothetical protein